MEHCHDICQVKARNNTETTISPQFPSHFRPLLVIGVCILVVYLLYWHYLENSLVDQVENTPPNHHKNVEHILMKESDLEEMDDTEHLYLEQ